MPPRRAFPTLGEAEPFGGRVHLECPIDIQTTLQTRDHRRIERVARAHTDRLAASAGGGFVAGYSVSNEALGLDPQYLETAARTCLQRGVRAWRRGP